MKFENSVGWFRFTSYRFLRYNTDDEECSQLMTMNFIIKLLSIQMVSLDVALSWRAHYHKKGRISDRHTVKLTMSSNTDDAGSSDEASKKSIADYTLGLHGGKYQFGDSTGFSSVGQDFAASLYASGDETQQVDYTAEALPDWAVRLSELTADSLKMYSSTIQTLPTDGLVTIVNEEMTWARYYAFIVPRGQAQVAVKPWVGMLSPRGGKETLQVTLSSLPCSDRCWLVIGTETDRWIYALPS